MKLKAIGLSLLLCTVMHTGNAQQKDLKPLSVGDKMPDLVFDSLIGFNRSSMKMADYKNKLVIFDFWSTWCHWCIEAFPKGDSLQQKFGNALQIMLVDCKNTDDTEKKVSDFYKKRLLTHKEFKLPTIYSDTVLIQLFPHGLIPHYVWVKDGTIKGITDQKEVTAANIKMILEGKKVQLNTKMQ